MTVALGEERGEFITLFHFTINHFRVTHYDISALHHLKMILNNTRSNVPHIYVLLMPLYPKFQDVSPYTWPFLHTPE